MIGIVLITAPVCGGDIFGSLGVLQSPSFSRQYPFDVSCFWVIQTGKSSVIDMLLTSFNPSSADCRDSYILLRDGMSSFGRTLAKWCGTDVGKSVSSSGNSMYVEYHNAAQAKGPLFDISWKERTPVPFKGRIVVSICSKVVQFYYSFKIRIQDHTYIYSRKPIKAWIILKFLKPFPVKSTL